MSFLDEIAGQYSKPVTLDFAQDFMKGLQGGEQLGAEAQNNVMNYGLRLAQQQQENEYNRAKLQQANDALEAKQDDREMEYLRHIASKDTVPAARKGLIQAYSDFRAQRGKDTNKDIINAFSQDDGMRDKVLDGIVTARGITDPVEKARAKKWMGDIMDSVGGNTMDGINAINSASKLSDDLRKERARSQLRGTDTKVGIQLNNQFLKDKAIQDAEGDISRADRGLQLLSRPNIQWRDLYESAADINRLITGSARLAQTATDKIDFNSAQKWWDKNKEKVYNQETSTINPQEVNNFRDRLQRMMNSAQSRHDLRLNEILNTQEQYGYRTSDDVQQTYNMFSKGGGQYVHAEQAATGVRNQTKQQTADQYPALKAGKTWRINGQVYTSEQVRSFLAALPPDQAKEKYKKFAGAQ